MNELSFKVAKRNDTIWQRSSVFCLSNRELINFAFYFINSLSKIYCIRSSSSRTRPYWFFFRSRRCQAP